MSDIDQTPIDLSKATPRPWFAERRDWKGEESPHRVYISGDRNVVYGDDEDDPDDEGSEVATAVAIVEGNRTSGGVTEANAELIVRAVNAHAKLLAFAELMVNVLDSMPKPQLIGWNWPLMAEQGRDAIAEANGETTPC